ncbi:MAG: alpha/beta hydrolase [Alphaproteobacteria bacterium]|nr:alpha/beta hydrolase [Alphaproteobacteria bacterium]
MPEITLSGPSGRIEARYYAGSPNNIAILLMHPHPLMGGTMSNKLIYTLYNSFVKMNISCMRFNFRGVGRSEGEFDNGEGELSDTAVALNWLQSKSPGQPIWVCGYSFGAWIAMQLLMRRPEIQRFIAISPPCNMHDFNFLAPCPKSGQIIHGAQDTIVPIENTSELVEKLNTQKNIKVDYQVLQDADHFYKYQIEEVRQLVCRYVHETLSPALQ